MKKILFVSFVFILFAAAAAAETIPTPPESMALYEGWNLISSPLEDGISNATIAKYCKIKSGPWIYDTSTKDYTKTDKVMPYVGAWVKVEKDCFVPKEDEIETIGGASLKKGWNIISGSGDFSELAGCTVTSGPWAYDNADNAYVKANNFDPSKGYWVKVSANCILSKKEPKSSIPLPDLTVKSIDVYTVENGNLSKMPVTRVSLNQKFKIIVTIANEGNAAVDGSSFQTRITPQGISPLEAGIAGLIEPGKTRQIYFYDKELASYSKTGIYTITSEVDDYKNVPETNEDNNIMSVKLGVF